jgi:hypothetical protein
MSNYTACEFIEKDNKYIEYFDNTKDGLNIIYSILFLFGLFLTYFGNKYKKIILSVLGFFPGFYLMYYVLTILSSVIEIDCSTIVVMSLLLGGFTSLISKFYVKFAYMILGFLVGSSLGYMLYIIVIHKINIGTIYIYNNSFIVTELVSGLLGSYLFYRKINELVMIFTSFVGAYFSIKYFDKLIFGNLNTPKLIVDIKNSMSDTTVLVMYIIIYMVLSISGTYIQYRRYKKNKLNINVNGPLLDRNNIIYMGV